MKFFNNKDETELFHSRDFWCEPDNLIEEILMSLAPHSGAYYSKACPIFSFEIQKLESLNLFTSILLRDGIVFLLDFFIRFPDPLNIRTKIFIHKNFSHIVPKSWESNILLFDTVTNQSSDGNIGIYVVNVSSNEVDFYEKALTEIDQLRKNGAEKIFVLPTTISPSGERSICENPVKIARFVAESRIEDVEYTSLERISNEHLRGSLFSISENLSVWCEDTYVRQLLSSLGSVELKAKSNINALGALELSMYHALEFYELGKSIDFKYRDNLWKHLEENIPSNKRGSINRIDGNLEDYINIELINVAKEILKKTRNKASFFDKEI